MIKLFTTLLFAVLTAFALCGAVFADVAAAPMYAIIFGIPALIIAVIIIILVLVIKMIIRNRKD